MRGRKAVVKKVWLPYKFGDKARLLPMSKSLSKDDNIAIFSNHN